MATLKKAIDVIGKLQNFAYKDLKTRNVVSAKYKINQKFAEISPFAKIIDRNFVMKTHGVERL